MKKALVLSGGGSKGAYEAGFIDACKELGHSFDIVTGTSIGALNGALYVQGSSKIDEIWDELDVHHVFNGIPDLSFAREDLMDVSNRSVQFIKHYITHQGADVTPFYHIVKKYFDEKAFFSSNVDFGLCTVSYPQMAPLYLTKEELGKHAYDYLLASAACFPAFPMVEIEGTKYLDGGYYDNLPIDLAYLMEADEVVVCDMHEKPIHPHYLNAPHVLYTNPYHDLGSFMDFDVQTLKRNKRLGYLTACQYFGKYTGKTYCFEKEDHPIFERFYHFILMIDIANRLGDHSDGSLFDHKFKERNRGLPLSIEDYTYFTCDLLGRFTHMDDTKVYTIKDFMKEAGEPFIGYMVSPEAITLPKSLLELKGKGDEVIIGAIINMALYNYHEEIMNHLCHLFPDHYLAAHLIMNYMKQVLATR